MADGDWDVADGRWDVAQGIGMWLRTLGMWLRVLWCASKPAEGDQLGMWSVVWELILTVPAQECPLVDFHLKYITSITPQSQI